MLIVEPDAGDKPLSRIIRIWMIIGPVGIAILIVFAVAVFGFGVPVHDRYMGTPVAPTVVRSLLLFMIPIFVQFATVGTLLFSRLRGGRSWTAFRMATGPRFSWPACPQRTHTPSSMGAASL